MPMLAETKTINNMKKNANESSEKYYALFNINGNPLYYVIADTKEKMLDKLNEAYGVLTGEEYKPYSMDDMKHSIYMGKKLPHFISDDFASVTDDKKVFKKDKKTLKLKNINNQFNQ